MNYRTASLVVCIASAFGFEFLPIDKFNLNFFNFIENLQKYEHFESVFLLKSLNNSYFDDKFIRNITNFLGIPVILSTGDSSFYLKDKFNENILTIVQYDSNNLLLQQLVEHLQHLRFCKIIFVLRILQEMTGN